MKSIMGRLSRFSLTISIALLLLLTFPADPFTVASNDLALSKTADPDANVAYHSEATYTLALSNSSAVSETNAVLTGALPDEVDFSRWLEGPADARQAMGVISWSGTKQSGSDDASFTVKTAPFVGTIFTNSIAANTDTAGDNLANNSDIAEMTAVALTSIYEIQRAADSGGDSPYKDQSVTTEGIIYAVLDNYVNNGVVQWNIGDMAKGASAQAHFVVAAAGNHLAPTLGNVAKTGVGQLGIYDVQGDGPVSPFEGDVVTVQGVVYADLQENDELDGFFMQDARGDGDANTSDGIFVYNNSYAVSNGDWVEVTGEAAEYNQLTEITNVSTITVISSGNTINPTPVMLPEATNGDLEAYEGMYVTFPHTFTVQQNYFQGRYGQLTLASGGRLYQATNIYAPGSAEAIALADENARRLLVLDDGSSDQNPNPIPYIGANNTLRAGDIVAANLAGALDEGLINSGSGKDYRLHPVTTTVSITRAEARAKAPDSVGGNLKVASFNVLNYFTTLDNSGEICGPSGDMACRGADSAEEFTRQRAKIITAMLTIEADIFGLMEIENNGYTSAGAIYNLVEGLNALAPAGVTYAYIDPGVSYIGADAIAVGLIYNSESVTPTGAAKILDDSVDPTFNDHKNRPALAQTFETSNGEKLSVAVNHLKSKGSACDDIGDPDAGDGQGNCNATRAAAAIALVNWLAGDPTGSGDPDFLIIGDLNSYAMEDPISAIKNAGYSDLLKQFMGNAAYSYVYDGMAGSLDHALAGAALLPQVTGASEWRINADEPSVIDYNTEYKSQDLYAPDPYRASDHDPVIVGLNLFVNTAKYASGNAGSGSDEASFTIAKIAKDVAGLALKKSASTYVISRARTITYTYRVTNTGDIALKNIMVGDDKLGFIGAISLTEKGDSATLIKIGVVAAATTNVATASATYNSTPVVATDTFTVAFRQEAPGNNCPEATITSVGSGEWNDPTTWSAGALPNSDDAVWIKSGHAIAGAPLRVVIASLCNEGRLESQAGRSMNFYLADFVRNYGDIVGLDGIGGYGRGSSIRMKPAGGWPGSFQFDNWGLVQAGSGSNGIAGGQGGAVKIYGRNSSNYGRICAGLGGNGSSGRGGKGGQTHFWGKYGGRGYLINRGLICGGDGGNGATGGGNGGNLKLISLPNVDLRGGIQRAGRGGDPGGGDGRVFIEPEIIALISLSGQKTVVEGGDIAIFGGGGWNLDLRNNSGAAISAAGNILWPWGRTTQ